MNVLTLRSTRFLLLMQLRGTKSYSGTKYKPIRVNVGDKVSVDRFITEKDLDQFTEISGDTNAIHVNQPKIFHGAYLMSLVSAVMGTKLPGHGSLLLKQKMRFPHACYVNQNVTINVEVAENRQNRFVKCSFTVFSHKDNVNCLEGEAIIMIAQSDVRGNSLDC